MMQKTKTIAMVLLAAIAIIGATGTTGLLAQHVSAGGGGGGCGHACPPTETNPTTGDPHYAGAPGVPAEPTGNPHQSPTCSGNPQGKTLSGSGQCPGAN